MVIETTKDRNDVPTISIRYDEDDFRLIEQAAVLARYKHLTTWVRDKSLDRLPGMRSGGSWSDPEDMIGRLRVIERTQDGTQALLALLIYLVRKRATAGEVAELIAACERSGDTDALVRGALPEFVPLLDRLGGLN